MSADASHELPVLFELREGVAFITLNRSECGNAIDMRMARGLLEAASRCTDSTVRAVVLKGAGKHFCVGGDIRCEQLEDGRMRAYVLELTSTLHAAVSLFTRLDAPVIAAAAGSIAGAGVGLLAMSDLAVAGHSAFITLAFTSVGLTPDTGVSHLLPALIGRRRALELLLTNRRLSAAEALKWGLVSRVAADEELASVVAALAAQLAAGPLRAFGSTKRLVRADLDALEAHMALEAHTIAGQRVSSEGKEGVAAYLARRAPVFT